MAAAQMPFVPELALSDHSSDLDHAGGEPAYVPGQAGDAWSEDELDNQPSGSGWQHQKQQLPGRSSWGDAAAGAVFKEWDRDSWDDDALCGAFAAAKEEFLVFNDPVRLYAPYEVPDDLRARAKEKGKESWKVRLALREAEARAAADASDGPVDGCKELSTLWYTLVGGRPKPAELPKQESKRSKTKAAKLRREEKKALVLAAKAPIDPYSGAAAAASKKRKHAEDGTTPADDAPLSPEGYTPMSPSFSPAHMPLSPSLSAVLPDFPPLDPPQLGEAAYAEEEGDYLDDDDDGGVEWDGTNATVQLDPAQWDDAPLLSAWELEEAAFAARHGTGKSWLTLATEAQALDITIEEHVDRLEAEKVQREAAAAAPAPAAAPKVDKVAERHLRRFAQAPPPSAAGPDDMPELSYD